MAPDSELAFRPGWNLNTCHEGNATKMRIWQDSEDLTQEMRTARCTGQTIAFVPTMGYLHDGHAMLIRRAAELAQGSARPGEAKVVVSIFVNPLQFGPSEDFERYPRDPEHDKVIAEAAGATDLFLPEAAELTPSSLSTTVDPGAAARVLCGRSRPGHFAGVTTIVAKLFNIVQADVAVFGWKDAQQLLIIRKMADDLNMPVKIDGVETVREADGLAMSSRNSYLDAEQRTQAPVLYRALGKARQALEQGDVNMNTVLDMIRSTISDGSSARIDYVEGVRMSDLQPLDRYEPGNTLIALAAFFGKTRLIDNTRL